MTIFTYIIVLLITGMILNIPLLRKPLSEDDGKWFYYAFFRSKGVRLFKNIYSHGYFGIPWISSIIYNTFGIRKIHAFNSLKVIWYSLTAVTIFWLTSCLYHNYILSFIAGLTFIIITAVPNTLFMQTYAEHFLILPINLSIIFTYYGITTGHSWYFILVGMMSSWAFQFKPTTLLFNVLLPLAFYFASKPLLSLFHYTLAFTCIYFIPLFLIRKYGEKARHLYMKNSIGPILILAETCLNRFSFKFPSKYMSNITYKDIDKAYTKRHYNKNIRAQWLSFKAFMLPAIKDLYLILLLAAVQLAYLFIKFDLLSLSMFLLFTTFLLTQQIQKNYYTPHFNPCWAPISILSAKTMCDFWPYLLNSGFYGWAAIAFLGYESIKIGRIIIKSFYKSEINSFGFLDPLMGRVFRLCEPIGKYIQENSNERDKLFVWGDQPSIYLYARRETFDATCLFLYAHNEQILREKEILGSMRENPPELLIFYNYKIIDGWNIKRLQDSIGIPYDHMKSFQITDDRHKSSKNPQGICFNFPLCRRNDKIYREILIDRAINAEVNNDPNQAREYLKKVLEITPEYFEASLRLALLDDVVSRKKQQSYIDCRREETNDPVNNSILLRLLSEINAEEGNFDSSMENLEKALALNPDDFRIYNALGELYFSMGKIEDAAKFFNRAVGLNVYSVDAYNNIGVILSQEGKRHDAAKCFQKALSIMPDHQDAHKNMENLTSV